MVAALPFYHIFGLTCCFFYMMRIGACCLLIPNPRDIAGFVKTLRSHRFTLLSGVNTLFNALMAHPDFDRIQWRDLDHVIAGGMAVQAAVAKRWKERTDRTIIEGYGLSETSPVVTVNRRDLPEWSGTIGYPLSSTEVRVRRADGTVAEDGEPGELCVRGPQVMAGYWNRPGETAAAMTPDGFFRTGDVAVIQRDGQVRIVDRMKDMILVSASTSTRTRSRTCSPPIRACSRWRWSASRARRPARSSSPTSCAAIPTSPPRPCGPMPARA